MKNFYFLFACIVSTSSIFAQITTDPKINKELSDWDPVRGPWLAESMQAVATNQAIPNRTFPEQFTPAEMFSQVPADKQTNIRSIIQENQQNSAPTERQNWERMNQFVNRPTCNLVMGRTYGDPHIKTFDGKTFSFQTVGEFVLAKSSDGNLEVQARQKPQSDEISLNTAIAMNVSGDKVAIYAMDAPDGNNTTPLRVNGQTIFLEDEMYYLPRGGTIEDKGKNYIITWPTGEKVEAKMSSSGKMKFMNVSVNVFPCSSLYMGVLGNANGNPNDDFGDRGGMLASSTIFDPMGSNSRNNSNLEKEHLAYIAKDFARYHRVNNQTTLFDYGFGQSTWSFTDETFPRVHLTLADLSDIDRSNAQRRCEQQGISREDMAGCIFDVGHANIAPTPRPVLNDRTAGGRPLPPVDGRTPNINRPTATSGTRKQIESIQPRTPVSSDVNKSTSTIENVDKEQRTNSTVTPQTVEKEGSNTEERVSKQTTEKISKPIETISPKPSAPVEVYESKNPQIETRPVESKPTPVFKPNTEPVSSPSTPISKESSPEKTRDTKVIPKPAPRQNTTPTPTPRPAPPTKEVSRPAPTKTPSPQGSFGNVTKPR